MSIDTREFRNALGWFATGVAVVTLAPPNGEPLGITVNSFSSVSLDPPLILWCLDKRSDTFDVFSVATHFAVNILAEDQQEISNRLATPGQHGLDGLERNEGAAGTPLLADALAHFECAVHARHDAGDHIILVGRVLDFKGAKDGRPLLYHRGAYEGLAG